MMTPSKDATTVNMVTDEVAPPAGWELASEGWDLMYGVSSSFEIDSSDEHERAEPGDLLVPRVAPVDIPIAFVDGTLRSELATWAEHAATGMRVPGLAGAYAVGAVTRRTSGACAFNGIRVGRLAIWGGGLTGDIVSPSGYQWISTPITDMDPDRCRAHLQDRMRRAEGDLALDAAEAGWNVVLDGPLNRIRSLHGLIAGYVKSHHRQILPEDQHRSVPELAVGDRTRMFTAGSDRYTCYMRVGHPRPGASRWSGIARLEFPAASGIVAVTERASLLAGVLPAYAGVAHRDGRAPVNLAPVKNLERRLAQTLGRVDLATRAAREAVISERTR